MVKRLQKRKTRYILKIIQILLVTIVIVTCITTAKYQTTATGNVTAKVAKLDLNTTFANIELTDILPGETNKYNFEVTNENCEVKMKYKIKINYGGYLPLKFELKRFEENETLGTISENLLGPDNITKSEFELGIDDNIKIHKYQLIVKWDENEKNYKYSDEIDYINVILDSYQVN